MIASFIDGRVRLRDPALKNTRTLAMVEALVKARPGVLSTTANQRTGSLLVEYDPASISREDLSQAAAMLQARFGGGQRDAGQTAGFTLPRISRKTEVRILGAALGLSMLGSVVAKPLHVAAGILFTLGMARHAYCRRKSLF